MREHGSLLLYVHGNHEGSLGRTAQAGHLDSHRAPELCRRLKRTLFIRTKNNLQIIGVIPFFTLFPSPCPSGAYKKQEQCSEPVHIVQELCESRGGRPGLSVLTSLMVSVGVKLY